MTLLEKNRTVTKLAVNILHKSNDFYEQSSDTYPIVVSNFSTVLTATGI